MSKSPGPLEDLLRQAPDIEPDEAAKERALAAAMAAFIEKTSEDSQGIRKPVRLKNAASAILSTVFRSIRMKKKTLTIAGGAFGSLLLLAVGSVGVLMYRDEVVQRTAGWTDYPPSSVIGQNDGVSRTEAPLVEAAPTIKAKPPGVPESAVGQRQPAAASPAPTADFSEYAAPHRNGLVNVGATLNIYPATPSQPPDTQPGYYRVQGRDLHPESKPNPLKLAKEEPVSTFSIDVDTASYAYVRASLNQNVLPRKDAVRLEELINYFPYDYPGPVSKDEPFKANVSVMPTPWNPETRLIHIGIKGYTIPAPEKPRSNLVFLIDTSGSMGVPNKLPLVQNSLKLLLDALKPEDRIAIVTYAGNAGTALEPTLVKDKARIASVIDHLGAGGSTAGAEGIRQAYDLVKQHFDPQGINRVILATDGDFNVGITNPEELKSFIERQRDTGIFLSVLGFGMGNYNDRLMQILAQNGNGNAAYIDTLNEARKTLVEEAGSTLFPIAQDVKIQVEFNPARVAEYRLIGYETRLLNRADFNNDRVDAGDIGSGHTVTALYEITPAGGKGRLMDDLRYGQPGGVATGKESDEYAHVKIRYKLPKSDTSTLITTPVGVPQRPSLAYAPEDARFAAAVAGFGQLLRGDPYLKNFGYDQVLSLAEGAKGRDTYGYRAEFLNLVRLAKNAPALPPPVR